MTRGSRMMSMKAGKEARVVTVIGSQRPLRVTEIVRRAMSRDAG